MNLSNRLPVDVDYVVLSPSMMTKPAPATEAELQQAYAKFVETQKKMLNEL